MQQMATTLAIVAALSCAASCGSAADLVGGLPDASGESGAGDDEGTVDAGADAGESSAVACEAGAARCRDNTPETCGNGRWQSGTPCGAAQPLCVRGTCSPEPPSCASGGPGLINCGAANESCCTNLAVTGGAYHRTYDSVGLSADGGYGSTATLAADGGPTSEADPATVSSFRLDKYDVTVGRFRQFVAAWNGGCCC